MHHRSVDVSKIHGLIIGVDKYQQSELYPYLGGHSVSNATSVLHSLIDVGALRGNLRCLFDEQATWRAILDAFDTHLVNNPKIEVGDPIFVYLAGYGNRTTSSLDWNSANKEVEMILPHDVSTFDAQRNYVPSTLDFALVALLQKLRHKKGKNIAVITDCRHVSTSARGAKNIRVRSTYDPSQHGVMELMADQVHDLFSDESSSSSPNLPTLWTEELINAIVTLGLNPSPHPSDLLKAPHETPGGQQEKVDHPTFFSAHFEGQVAVDDSLDTIEHQLASQSQKTMPIESAELPRLYSPHHSKIEQNKNLNFSELGISRLHGIIIGVNKYKRSDVHPELLGCVGDAQSMLKYFTDLGIPEDNFLCLYNEHATRDGILNAFVDNLINNKTIRLHDPIVIYFAGHGDRVVAPRGWQSADGYIETILPHDASSFDAYGHYIHGIPDLTLAFLLYKLSQEKGNNITVILDSCHSGSGTRGETRSRSSHDSNAPPVPDQLDARLRGSLSVNIPSEIEHDITLKRPSRTLMVPSLETHILLAACRAEEKAYEITNTDTSSCDSDTGDPRPNGVFTTALLEELRNCDLETTSYTSLIRNLLVPRRKYRPKNMLNLGPQTFQCEGRNQDRLLFSVQCSISRGKIALIQTSDKFVYQVRVGSAQGVVPGTEFGIFSGGMDPTSPPLAVLVAKNVGSIISQLHRPEPNAILDIPVDAYATIIKYNDRSNEVRIWADEEVKRDLSWQSVLTSLDSLPIFWATLPENHDISLSSSDGNIKLQSAHLIPGELRNSRILKRTLGTRALVEILTAVIYFHFHLKTQNKEAPVRMQLGMALRELNEKDHAWGSIIYEPKGYDLFGDSLSVGTVATLRADPHKIFGLELTNASAEDLYPYVLYFDFEDYSIGCLYEPPSRSIKPPLPAGRSITIGYGSGGSQPFQVNFTNPLSDKEYGAFVLLVFNEWVDIAYLQQESPFDSASWGHRGAHHSRQHKPVWDSLIVHVEILKTE